MGEKTKFYYRSERLLELRLSRAGWESDDAESLMSGTGSSLSSTTPRAAIPLRVAPTPW